MRELKFRAWTGNKMVILENSGLQYFDFEGSYSLGFTVDAYDEFWAHERYEISSAKASKFPIMQFTGLKDKNGKEIYEGDILQWTSAHPFTLGEIRKGKVYYIEAHFWCKGAIGVYLGELLSDERCEVIGNIYEIQNY